MKILDGRAMADAWRIKISQQVTELRARGITPGLAVVLVGDDPASVIYTNMKEKASRSLGFHSVKKTLPAEASTAEIKALLATLNADPSVHGILVQLPLPDQVDTDAVLATIDPLKDVDGLHPYSLGELLIGNELIVPATPRGIMRLIEAYQIETVGRHVVIVGRSNILGKPLAAMFLNRDATVTICHSKTQDLASLTRLGDIVVMDTGVPELLTAAMVKDGAIIIDAGITKTSTGSLVGDVKFDEVKDKVAAITPVPGGVGPMTIVALLQNTLDLARQSDNDRATHQ